MRYFPKESPISDNLGRGETDNSTAECIAESGRATTEGLHQLNAERQQWLIDEGEEDHGGAVEFVCDTHLTLTDPNPDPEPHPHPDTHPNQVRCTHLDDPAVRLIAPSLLVAGTHAPSATAQPTCSQVS